MSMRGSKLPVGKVCVKSRKGTPGKWNSMLKAVNSGVCLWDSKEIDPGQKSCLQGDCGKSRLLIWRGTS